MLDLKIIKISYGELKEKPIEVKDDRYDIAAYFTESVRQTFLACPCIQDDSECAVILLMDGDIVIGRDICFMTRLKIGDEIVPVHTGCSQMVCEEYRKIGAGVLLFTANSNIAVHAVTPCHTVQSCCGSYPTGLHTAKPLRRTFRHQCRQ